MTNSNLSLVEAGTFIVKKVNKLREYKTEETIFLDILGGDRNFVENNNNSECVFLLSPLAYCEAFNYKPVLTSSLLGANIISTKLYGRIPVIMARDQASEYIKQRELAIIPKEYKIGEEVKEIVLVYSYKTELDTTDLPKLPYVL
jgi:hypothetical protein